MHNLLDDFAQEQDLYLKTESLIDCLYNWRPTNTNLFRQMLEIMLMLQERHFVQQSDVALVTAWIEDLINIGYDDTLSH